jgi:hypothetical protein
MEGEQHRCARPAKRIRNKKDSCCCVSCGIKKKTGNWTDWTNRNKPNKAEKFCCNRDELFAGKKAVAGRCGMGRGQRSREKDEKNSARRVLEDENTNELGTGGQYEALGIWKNEGYHQNKRKKLHRMMSGEVIR